MSRELVRRWWPLAAGVLLGVVLAMPLSLLGTSSRKAEAKVLINSPTGTSAVRPLLPNLRELATSGVVAGNVKSTLRLTESAEGLRRHLDASVQPGSEVIAIAATDANADKARQLAQEAAVVFTQLVEARFGNAKPELHAAVLDSAHVLGGPDRHFVRNGVVGGLIGLLLGSAAMFVLAARGREFVVVGASGNDRGLEKRERLVEQRLKGVTERERSLARRAGQLGAQEKALAKDAKEVGAREKALAKDAKELGARERGLSERERALEARPPVPEPPAPQPPPAAEPAPAPEPQGAPIEQEEQVPPASTTPQPAGAWTLTSLERIARDQRAAFPDRADEWDLYLYLLREHATIEGSLPRSFDSLIAEVFGDALFLQPQDSPG